jgi:hypothetical protein
MAKKSKKGLSIIYNYERNEFSTSCYKSNPEDISILSGPNPRFRTWFITLKGGDDPEKNSGKFDKREWRRFLFESSSDERIDKNKFAKFLTKQFSVKIPEIGFEDV